MPLVSIIAGAGFVGALVAWGLARRAERVEPHALDAPPMERSPTARHLTETTTVVILGLVLVAGLMFDAFDRGSAFGRFDRALAQFGADTATATSTRILDLITSLGGTPLVTVVTVLVALHAIARTRSWWPVLYLTLVSAGQAIVNNGIKIMVERERPAISQLADFSGASFPSGHAAAAAASFAGFAFVLVQNRSRFLRIAIAAMAAFVAISVAATRALLGVHWLTDVVAGLAVGWAWFLLVTAVLGRRVTEAFADRSGPVREGVRS